MDGLLATDTAFNWIFLVELLVYGLITLFFLFYVNRVFGSIVSYVVRLYTWHKYGVYVDVQALQISLLGGRFFFKGLRYQGDNETVLIRGGSLTWRYWLRKVQHVELEDGQTSSSPNQDAGAEESAGGRGHSKLPCRVLFTCQGLEWFVYNRKPAYDGLIASMFEISPSKMDISKESSRSRAEKNPEVQEPSTSQSEAPRHDLEKSSSASSGDGIQPQTPVSKITDPKAFSQRSRVVQSGLKQKFRNGGDGQESYSSSSTDDLPSLEAARKEQLDSYLLQLLPIRIECSKGAVVLGNDHTSCVLIAQFERAMGGIKASSSQGPDLYKQAFEFEFKQPKIQIKPNPDFSGSQLDFVRKNAAASGPNSRRSTLQGQNRHRESVESVSFWNRLARVLTFRQDLEGKNQFAAQDAAKSSKPDRQTRGTSSSVHEQWPGLSRYVDDDPEKAVSFPGSDEYAANQTILESSSMTTCFYWDVVGFVEGQRDGENDHEKPIHTVNGDVPPAWGLSLRIQGGTINYGPWADRQRVVLQNMFFPQLYKDALPITKLETGQPRIYTNFKVVIDLEGETTLRVPIREKSKDWKWKKSAGRASTSSHGNNEQKNNKSSGMRRRKKAAPAPAPRPAGWIDIKVAADSSVVYNIDMVAGKEGYSSKLNLELRRPEVSSSVNHGLLLRSESMTLLADLSTPLQWNGLHEWYFKLLGSQAKIFFLREHVFLLSDLVNDWGSGPGPDYYSFTPFTYTLNLECTDLTLYMNVNDSNVINNPADFDDNTYVAIYASQLMSSILIPLDRFQSDDNTVSFDVTGHSGGLELHTPPWNTQAAFLSSTKLAHLEDLNISGSYHYFSLVEPYLTDTLTLDIHGSCPSIELYGFFIRYLLLIKDNYFGDDIRFKTLEEYQSLRAKFSNDAPVNVLESSPKTKTNDLDVILSVEADSCKMLLPAHLYSCREHVQVEFSTLSLDLRFTSYYMDLSVIFSPFFLSQGSKSDPELTPNDSSSATQLYVDGIEIYGHRVFGLPPKEPTYICNWDFSIGTVKGDCSLEYARQMSVALRNIAFSYDDDENALPEILPIIIHDITYLRLDTKTIKIALHVDDVALLLNTSEIQLLFNDFADLQFSERMSLSIPEISISCLDGRSAVRRRSLSDPVTPYALLHTGLSVKMLGRKSDFDQALAAQQEHVRSHDTRTHRTPFFLHDQWLIEPSTIEERAVPDPAMTFPPVPTPMKNIRKSHSFSESSSSNSFYGYTSVSSSKSSFLSNTILNERGSLRKQVNPSKHDFAIESPRNIGQRNLDIKKENSAKFQGDISFSSAFSAPSFPLDLVNINYSDQRTPRSMICDNKVSTALSKDSAIYAHYPPLESQAKYSAFLIDVTPGLHCQCSPKILQVLPALLDGFAPQGSEDLLDVLQIDVVRELLHSKESASKSSGRADMHIKVPEISVTFNPFKAHDTEKERVAQEGCLQFSILDASLTTSQEKNPDVRSSQSIVRSYLSRAEMLFGPSASAEGKSQSAVRASIDQLDFWMASGEAIRADLNIRDIDSFIDASHLEFLSKAIPQMSKLVGTSSDQLQELSSSQTKIGQTFVFDLICSTPESADPTFLTRPSYVLRSAADHVRLSDSWKIVSKLRSKYRSLKPSAIWAYEPRALLREGTESTSHVRDKALEALKSWRQWDLADVDSSIFMKQVYGEHNESTQSSLSFPNCAIKSNVEKMSFSLDTPPKTSGVFFKSASVELKITPATSSLDPDLSETTKGQICILSLYAEECSADVDWGALELARDVAEYLEKKPTDSNVQHQEVLQGKPTKLFRSLSVHLLVGAEICCFNLALLTLHMRSEAQEVKSSLLGTIGQLGSDIHGSILCGADRSTLGITAHEEKLILLEIRRPGVFVSLDKTQPKDDDLTLLHWKGTAACQRLAVDVLQGAEAILEVLQELVERELTFILQLIPKTAPNDSMIDTEPKGHQKTQHKIDTTLFLDTYKIRAALVRSLEYSLSGNVARMGLSLLGDSNLRVDFDLKRNVHEILSGTGRPRESLALIHIPPINGRILHESTPLANHISVSVSMESMVVDASAIHSVWKLFKTQAVQSTLRSVKANGASLKNKIGASFGPRPERNEIGVSKSKRHLYKVQVTLAEIRVRTVAAANIYEGGSAFLEFNINSVHLKARNQRDSQGQLHETPEVHVGLREIRFELLRQHESKQQSCGKLLFSAYLSVSNTTTSAGNTAWAYHASSQALRIDIQAETAATMVDVVSQMQQKLKNVHLEEEKKYLQKLRKRHVLHAPSDISSEDGGSSDHSSSGLLNSIFSFDLLDIRVSWIVHKTYKRSGLSNNEQDLVLSFKRIGLDMKKEHVARLTIDSLQLQMVPPSMRDSERSLNSALLPEIIFNVAFRSTEKDWHLAFQAAGKSLDLRITSQFIIPAKALQRSLDSAVTELRRASKETDLPQKAESGSGRNVFGRRRLGYLLVDIDFAGATVYFQGKGLADRVSLPFSSPTKSSMPDFALTSQLSSEGLVNSTTLQAPGVAFKFEYQNDGMAEPSLNGEVKVDGSKNILYPTVVPLILEMTESIKEIVSEPEDPASNKTSAPRTMDGDTILNADPSAVFGRIRLNIGLRICRQEFGLSCQPIAKVSATAQAEDIYIIANTLESNEEGRFLAISGGITGLRVSVQHVYSRESTASFGVDSIVMSLMNSKHVSGAGGVSTILQVSPIQARVNAKQLQDFLLFREIWLPAELTRATAKPATPPAEESQNYLVQRYQQVATSGNFTWNATVFVDQLDVGLDLGQGLGKSSFQISKFWMSSKKPSNKEQNLCVNLEEITINSTGRMSGMIRLEDLKMRTSIKWTEKAEELKETPLIQASIGFKQLLVKTSFDYQIFLVADISAFEFLMYNVRDRHKKDIDQLVAILDGSKVQVFCTTSAASQSLALYQAFQRLIQEKKAAYEVSVKDMQRYLQRRTPVGTPAGEQTAAESLLSKKKDDPTQAPISLHTDVVVTLQRVNVGAFPSTFFDSQVFKIEALDAQARFGVAIEDGKIHSGLGMTLGQLRIALSGVRRQVVPKSLGDVGVEEIISSATGSRGGTVLKVPKVVASMQTWQVPLSNQIDYIFKSSFEGKVDVGWNYSRISFIRGMWSNHSRALAQRLGKPLPPSAVQITGGPEPPPQLSEQFPSAVDEAGVEREESEQGKMTAVVNVPQSKYAYRALEPPIIETPQLRDMGEATPPLEWIGLHRERLPNVTHQIVIVTLLELAREVEDAYSKILGSS